MSATCEHGFYKGECDVCRYGVAGPDSCTNKSEPVAIPVSIDPRMLGDDITVYTYQSIEPLYTLQEARKLVVREIIECRELVIITRQSYIANDDKFVSFDEVMKLLK